MRLTVLAAAALAAVSLTAVPARAVSIWAVPASDGTCALSSATSPSGPTGVFTGTVQAGPLAVPAPYTSAPATVTCTIQVGGPTHRDPDTVSATGPLMPSPVALAPAPVTFAPGTADVYLCTRLDIAGGVTLYRYSANDPTVDDHWTLSPDAPCRLGILADAPGAQPVAVCGGGTNGHGAYTPPVTATAHPVSWTIDTEVDCAGAQPLAGHYSLHLSGTDTWSCPAGGSGTASVSGTGPNGALTGSLPYGNVVAGISGNGGTITDATGTYAASLTVVAIPSPPGCGFSNSDVQGAWGLLG